MFLCLSALVIMLLNYSKITTNAKCNKMVTLTRYHKVSAAQVQCIIVNCGTFTNMPSLAALEQPFQAAISSPRNRRNLCKKLSKVFFSDIVKIADLHAHNASQREAL